MFPPDWGQHRPVRLPTSNVPSIFSTHQVPRESAYITPLAEEPELESEHSVAALLGQLSSMGVQIPETVVGIPDRMPSLHESFLTRPHCDRVSITSRYTHPPPTEYQENFADLMQMETSTDGNRFELMDGDQEEDKGRGTMLSSNDGRLSVCSRASEMDCDPSIAASWGDGRD